MDSTATDPSPALTAGDGVVVLDAGWALPGPPPLPQALLLAAELVDAYRVRLAAEEAVLVAQRARDAALAVEQGLRARVEVAMANERRARVELPCAVVTAVSARIRRSDPENTVVAASGLRIVLRPGRVEST